jgi:hypothetical protein
MRVEFTEDVLPDVLEALGYGISENGYIIKNGEMVEASDGDKIHYKNVGLIKKDEDGNKIIVRTNAIDIVNEMKPDEISDENGR